MFHKVKLYKFIKRYLPIFLSVFVCFPLNAKAEQLGVGTYWDGVVNILGDSSEIYLNCVAEQSYNVSGTSVSPTYSFVTYEGDVNLIAEIEMYETDVYLNGFIRKRLNFNMDYDSSHAVKLVLSATAEPIIMNGVYISVQNVERNKGFCSVDLYINFDNYYVKDDNLRLPVLLNLDYSGIYNHSVSLGIYPSLTCSMSDIDDWYGDVWQYDRLDDVPSMDGYFAEQNTEIINQQTINNELIQQQIQQDHEDTLQQTDTLTNGYDNSIGAAASDKLDNSISDLNDMEDSLFGTVGDASEDYTDISNFFTNLQIVESFSFVRSLMESIFVAMGDFSVPLTVGFLFFILVKILGYQQFASGGDS